MSDFHNMSDRSNEISAVEFLKLFGSNTFVCCDFLAQISRCFYDDALINRSTDFSEMPYRLRLTSIALEDLTAACSYVRNELRKALLYIPTEQTADIPIKDKRSVTFSPSILSPAALVRVILGGIKREKDLHYWTMRAIRIHYNCEASHESARILNLLAESINQKLSDFTANSGTGSVRIAHPEVIRCLNLNLDVSGVRNPESWSTLFLEICRAVGYVLWDSRKRAVQFRSRTIDSEFIFSQLFGLPTSIRGLDQLFGGNGILLPERPQNYDESVSGLPGRTILIRGPSGSGKTLLAFELAVEVARKGGIAWLMLLEQTPAECLYVMEAFGLNPQMDCVVLTTREELEQHRFPPQDGKGVLVILKVAQASVEGFLSELSSAASQMSAYSLPLLLADPLNSIPLEPHIQQSWIRAQLVDAFDDLNNSQRVNLALVAETRASSSDHHGPGYDSDMLDSIGNIADTVISLSVKRRAGYTQRYFEIVKSRYQREQRGEHPFAVDNREGIRIAPSPAAVLARVSQRSIRPATSAIEFGIPSIDSALNRDVFSGDAIVVRGDAGLYKTDLGLQFLLASDDSGPSRLQSHHLTDPNRFLSRLMEDDTSVARKFRAVISRKDLTLAKGDPSVEQAAEFIVRHLNELIDTFDLAVDDKQEVRSDGSRHWRVARLDQLRVQQRILLPEQNRRLIENTYADEFLFRAFPRLRSVSLWVGASDDETTMSSMLHRVYNSANEREPKEVIVCSMPVGFIDPGYILQRVQEELSKADRRGTKIDRVLIDDVAHWEDCCPLVAEDRIFGDVLVELMRRHNVTSMLICSDRQRAEHGLQASIIDRADCLIDLRRVERRGTPRVMFRVLRTRNMNYTPEPFELLSSDKGQLVLQRSFPLVRVGDHGQLTSVSVRLFLHSETQMQADYNEYFANIIRSSVADKVSNAAHELLRNSFTLSLSSALDELQVAQLDEFQVSPERNISEVGTDLISIGNRAKLVGHDVDEFLADMTRNTARHGQFYAVPYYGNVSLMAYRLDEPTLKGRESLTWKSIAQKCRELDASEPILSSLNRDQDESRKVFFDYPKKTHENINTLFLEILAQYAIDEIGMWPRQISATDILSFKFLADAAMQFRQICRRAYLLAPGHLSQQFESGRPQERIVNHVRLDAKVWRHWYSTLNQMFEDIDISQRRRIGVKTLPGRVTTAGEWYLGIPRNSASPHVAMNIIKLFTSREEELERLYRGVGLPVRKFYYEGDGESGSDKSSVSPYFEMPFSEIASLSQRTIRRSQIESYQMFRKPLAASLRRVLEIPESPKQGEIIREIEGVFSRLRHTVRSFSR